MENNIVQLPFGIKGVKAEKVEYEGDISIVYLVKQMDFGVCPCCGTISNKIKDRATINRVIDIPIPELKIKYRLVKRRFKCINTLCTTNTFTEAIDGLRKSHVYTDPFTNYIYHLAKRSTCSEIYQHLKKDYGLDISRSSFYLKYQEACLNYSVDNDNPVSTPYIGLDEFSKGSGHDYGVVITDLAKKKIIEMVDGGKTKEAAKHAISFVETEKITACCIDMWEPFKLAIAESIPNALIVIDPFHVIQKVNEAVDKVRKRVRKRLKLPEKKESLFDVKSLILSGSERITDKQVIKLWEILSLDVELKKAYEFKELLRMLYKRQDKENVPKYFSNWIKEALYSGIPEVIEASTTYQNWFSEILNWWKHPISNGFTEGIVNKIKTVDRRAYHYNNFESLRHKVLTIQNNS